MKRISVLTFLIVVAITTLAFAQAKPDFSGTWVLDDTKSNLGRVGPGAKQAQMRTVTLVLKQTHDTLTIQRAVGEQKGTAVYKLDGSESTNKLPSGDETKSRLKWVDGTLVSRSTTKISNPKVEVG